MKRLAVLILSTIISTAGFAQKFAYVDSDYILNKIPSYKAAQEQLDKQAQQY